MVQPSVAVMLPLLYAELARGPIATIASSVAVHPAFGTCRRHMVSIDVLLVTNDGIHNKT